MDQAVLTEMSVFYRLSAEPRTPVHKLMPFMVDPRSGVVERVVPRQEYKGENKFSDLQASSIPGWVISSKAANLVFLYTLSNRNTILCTYYVAYKLLACTGIKYNNAQTFYVCIVSLFDIISVPEPDAPSAVLYKACGVAQIYRPWNKDAFADIITNNHKVACCMAINESSGLLGNKRILPLNILVDCILVRAVVTYSGRGSLVFKLSKLRHPDMARVVMLALREVAAIFDDDVRSELTGASNCSKHNRKQIVQGIEGLRNEVPDLFVNNYTRECPVLPIIVSKDIARELDARGARVIYYYGKYYVAPEGYFVGLKLNRLSNKHKYTHLISCYMSDHMRRPNSDTYRYFVDGNVRVKKTRYRPVPRSIYTSSDSAYSRVRVESLVTALEMVTGAEGIRGRMEDQSTLAFQVVKQEMWDEEDSNIVAAIKGYNNCDLSLMYRCFEELLRISIHVVVVTDGRFGTLLPRHVEPYIWEPPYPDHTVVFENTKITYGKRHTFYEVLMRKDTKRMLLDVTDDIVGSIISNKLGMSLRPSPCIPDAVAQLIDDNGKCRAVKTEKDDYIHTFTRPMNLPSMPVPSCFFDEHTDKMNKIKSVIGVQPLDLFKTSTKDLKYFPNDRSFREWLSLEESKYLETSSDTTGG